MAAHVLTAATSSRTIHFNLSAFVNPKPVSILRFKIRKNFDATVRKVVEDEKSSGALQFLTTVDDMEDTNPKESDRQISDMPMVGVMPFEEIFDTFALSIGAFGVGIMAFEKMVTFCKSAFLNIRMEKSEEMVVLPLLMERNYRACTIPYRFPSDNPKKPTPTELSWINLFANSIPSFRKRAESDDTVPDAPARAEKFAQRYTEILEDLKEDTESHGGPPNCLLLCQLRDQVLREVRFRDIFKKVKDEENAKAISIFQDVVHLNDAIEDEAKRMENLIRGIFAGNIFDLGSAQLEELFAKDCMSFQATSQNLVPRPWVIDDLDEFISKWVQKSWKRAVIFVDNSGADIILGILPFARELLRHGVQVVLAANDLPSINDITYPELIEILAKLKDENGKLLGVDTSDLFIVNSGNDLPVIDLTRVSQELSYLASDADLVILEGMGRGIETNLYAQFKCDSLKIAMVKHLEVAQFLEGRLYDCVFKYNECLD